MEFLARCVEELISPAILRLTVQSSSRFRIASVTVLWLTSDQKPGLAGHLGNVGGNVPLRRDRIGADGDL
jgi:hypothetical protein